MARIARKRSEIAKGIESLSRSDRYHKSGRWVKKPTEWKKVAKKVQKVEPKVKKFGKEGKETRTIKRKAPRFYSAEHLPHPYTREKTPRTAALRSSITPGTILILLAGRFRGKRVVFIKQLSSGLLLVTGPFKVNGVPIRRVNQRYVIATSTKVDISGVKLNERINDEYFKIDKKEKKAKEEKKNAKKVVPPTPKKGAKVEKVKKERRPKKALKPERLEDQKAVDAPILAAIKKVPELDLYLHSRFSLSKRDYPHLMKF